ncbi:EAL domain-containing protein [Streptomyces canus]|uniref:putative bifunctional diguanylate cyclase/phosphodiesterase n=1 Tax=Streptomyces canus TaxID=58343 RepID=UPI0036E897EE
MTTAYLTVVAGLTAVSMIPSAPHVPVEALIGLVGTAAVLTGVRVHRPTHRWPWFALAAGLLVFTAGDTYYDVQEHYFRASAPSPADACFLAVYPLFAAGLFGLVRYRWVRRDLPSLLDALIVTAGLGLPVWIYLAQPLATMGGLSWQQRAISIAYPLGDLVLLAMVARLLAAGPRSGHHRAVQLLALGTVTLLGFDIAYEILWLNDNRPSHTLLDAGWIVFYTTWGLAALHPSMARLTEPEPRPESLRPQWRRLVLLTVATLIAPYLLIIEERTGSVRDATVLATFSTVLFLLVILRLAGMVVAHRKAVEREQALRAATASLVAAMAPAEIARACETAVTALMGPDVPHRTLLVPDGEAHDCHGLLADAAPPRSQQNAPPDGCVLIPADRLGPDIVARLDGLPNALVCPVGQLDRKAGDDLPNVLVAAGPQRELSDVRGSVEILASHAGLAADRIGLRREIVRRESEAYFRTLVRSASDVILIINDDTTVRYASPSAQAVLGSAALTGTALRELVDPRDRGRVESTLTTLGGDARKERHDHWRVLRGGGHIEVEVRCRDLRQDETVGGLVVTLRDVTEQRQLEQELTQRAFHDSVTGLPNRTLLLERTGRALLRGRRESSLTCLLFIDLDDFKTVNDTLGHSAGDRLLKAVGERLEGTLRRTDTAARLGGDEFAVLMENAKLPLDAELLASQVIQTLSRPFRLAGDTVKVSASVGVATALDTTDAQELLALADLALYAAKAAGKRQWRRFRPQLRTRMAQRQDLRVRLDDALAQGEFALLYQPVVDFVAGEVVGFEALARWPHRRHGPVPPGQFIPLAEETGRITPLGAWVLHSATADMARLQDQVRRSAPPYVSVNVSGRQWQDEGFIEEVSRALGTPGLFPGSLQLELTESVLMRRNEQIDGVIRDLKDLGVRIAVDDFGTGFSSLRYLRDFPLDVLKIDKSFIDDIPHDARQVKLVEGIVRLADTLEVQVIAEGIEAPEQRDLLTAMGCRYGQGFLFAPPMTLDEGTAVLRNGEKPFEPPR